MKTVFADTAYWIAVTNPKDQLNEAAQKARKRLGAAHLVTTDVVLIEFLDAFASSGKPVRRQIATIVRQILADRDVTVLPGSRESFLAGLEFYERRLDKGYSLTDCISMTAMKAEGIQEVLSADHHFLQEGFAILLDLN